jgi:hypothetical protein
MAISTFSLIHDNPLLFSLPLLKIRKGTAAQLMLDSTTLPRVSSTFLYYLSQMRAKNEGIRKRGGIEVEKGIAERFEASCGRAEEAARKCGGGEWDFAGVRTGLVLAVGAALIGYSMKS